ncbi:hypothetical protein CBS101457_006385 [Exobasidium rhododendri]|nr:hypothetical protein CBS101457_006385 [Exobasidium rhododendri]
MADSEKTVSVSDQGIIGDLAKSSTAESKSFARISPIRISKASDEVCVEDVFGGETVDGEKTRSRDSAGEIVDVDDAEDVVESADRREQSPPGGAEEEEGKGSPREEGEGLIDLENGTPLAKDETNTLEEEIAKQISASPLQDVADIVAAEASITMEGAPNGLSELQRLRDLVFASRGSKASLPAGWDDEEVEKGKGKVEAEVGAEVEGSVASQVNVPEHVDAAQKMLQRAISLVGQMASDSDSESETSSSSESDSASSTSSTASNTANRKAKRRAPVREAASSDEEDGGGGGGAKGPTTKNEVLEPTVDPPPYSIVPVEKEIRQLGKVHSIIDCVVVVAQDVGKAPGPQQTPQQQARQSIYQAPFDMHGRKGEEEGEYSVLDTGSLLAFNDRNVLGVVYETFGSVLSPLYALRYPSASHINQHLIKVGKEVGYVPSHSTYVLTRALRALGKGSDASNLWDEEIGDDEREFSDDEAEANHKRSAKASKGKSKKRDHPEALEQSTAKRSIKHSLPNRPMLPPVHRDAEGINHQSVALSYDEEDMVPQGRPAASTQAAFMYQHPQPQQQQQQRSLLPTPPPQDPYAQWAYQQQHQPSMLPPLRFQGHHSYPTAQQAPSSSSSSFPTSSSASAYDPSSIGDSYDPQQPLFGLARSPPSQWSPQNHTPHR